MQPPALVTRSSSSCSCLESNIEQTCSFFCYLVLSCIVVSRIIPYLIAILPLWWAGASLAQVSLESPPVSWSVDDELSENLSFVSASAPDVLSLLIEDEEEALTARALPMRYATKQNIDLSPDNSGRWTNLPNGDRIWLLGLHSMGALSLGITFDTFKLPKGAAIFLYNPDKTEVIGAITEANNHASRTLTTGKIKGDSLIVEYYEPYAVRHQGRLNIRTLAHTYRQPEVEYSASICGFNPMCSEVESYAKSASSVVLINVDDGTRLSTGTLLNNTNYDGKPYVLMHSGSLIGDPGAWHFTFRYTALKCADTGATRVSYSLSGAELHASDDNTSIALIELFNRPQPEWQVYYCGWDASGTTPQKVASIHHPFGGVKKIALSGRAATPIELNGAPSFRVDYWEFGSTAASSTGGPLFSDIQRVKGLLQSGLSSCDEDSDADFFSDLAGGWEVLKPYLDPFDQGVRMLAGTYLGFAEVDERLFEDNLAIFPIPAKDRLNVINDNDEAIEFISIYDMMGRRLIRERHSGQSIDLSDLPVGNFIVEIEFLNSVVRRQMMKWE